MRQNVLRAALLLFSILFLLLGCQQASVDSLDSTDFGSGAQAVLPPDTVDDESRVIGSSFAFETLYTLGLDLKILPYEADPNGGSAAVPGNGPAEGFIITLEDLNGNELFRGKSDADANLIADIFVPSAVDAARLRINAEGFEARTILLENLADTSTVDRELPLLKSRSSMLSMSLEGSGGRDNDGDGVPNDFDAFPDDPERAFVANVPAEGSITVAYEDLFGRAQAGDADYNDFIVSYKLKIITNEQNLITDIEFNDITMVQKLAGYTHLFGFRIDSFSGGAVISSSGTSKDTTKLGHLKPIYKKKVKAPVEFPVFNRSSADLVGTTTSFKISFNEPQSMIDDGSGKFPLSPPPFNPYIYVYNTGHDIHLIDAEPLSSSINSGDDFRDDEGFPWALLIPTDWEHPAEGQRIEELYPRFTSWRESWGAEDEDWYLGEVGPGDVLPAVIGAAVTDEDAGLPGIQTSFWYGAAQFTIQLKLDDSDSAVEEVLFKSSALPSYIELDEKKGVLTVTPDWSEHSDTVYFWSEGVSSGEDTADAPLRIDFLGTSG